METYQATLLALGSAALQTDTESGPAREPEPPKERRSASIRAFLAEFERAFSTQPVVPQLQRWPY